MLSNALLCIAERPNVWARLRREPALVPQAIEEVLRYCSPVQSMFRTAAADVTLGEQTIPRGASVIAWIDSANRDHAQFPTPIASTSIGSPTGISRSGMASTIASAHRSPAWRRRSRFERCWSALPK